jgi:Flp pilus assembly protein TadG
MMHRLQRLRLHSNDEGSTMVETSLMIVVIFAVVFWVFEICMFIYTYTTIADAANEGVRYAVVNTGGDSSGTTTKVRTYAQISLHDVSAMTTSVTFPDGDATPPNRVRVTVTYTYVPYLSTYFTNPPRISAYAEGRMIR